MTTTTTDPQALKNCRDCRAVFATPGDTCGACDQAAPSLFTQAVAPTEKAVRAALNAGAAVPITTFFRAGFDTWKIGTIS